MHPFIIRYMFIYKHILWLLHQVIHFPLTSRFTDKTFVEVTMMIKMTPLPPMALIVPLPVMFLPAIIITHVQSCRNFSFTAYKSNALKISYIDVSGGLLTTTITCSKNTMTFLSRKNKLL